MTKNEHWRANRDTNQLTVIGRQTRLLLNMLQQRSLLLNFPIGIPSSWSNGDSIFHAIFCQQMARATCFGTHLWISFLSFFMCLRSKLIISFRRDNDSGVLSIFVFSCYGGCRNGKPWKTGFMYAFLFFTSLDGVYRCCLVVPSSRKVVYNKQCAQCRELCNMRGADGWVG